MSALQENIATPEIGSLYEPEPVLFSFEAPGWQVVGVLALIVLITGAALLIRRHRRRAYRRLAVAQLASIPTGDAAWSYHVNRLLKMVAIKTYGRTQVAPLAGAAWADFLLSTGMRGEAADPLANHYDVSSNLEESQISELTQAAKTWIRRHA